MIGQGSNSGHGLSVSRHRSVKFHRRGKGSAGQRNRKLLERHALEEAGRQRGTTTEFVGSIAELREHGLWR